MDSKPYSASALLSRPETDPLLREMPWGGPFPSPCSSFLHSFNFTFGKDRDSGTLAQGDHVCLYWSRLSSMLLTPGLFLENPSQSVPRAQGSEVLGWELNPRDSAPIRDLPLYPVSRFPSLVGLDDYKLKAIGQYLKCSFLLKIMKEGLPFFPLFNASFFLMRLLHFQQHRAQLPVYSKHSENNL